MTISAELRLEVLERMAELGRGRTIAVSVIARHGDARSTGAVWAALEQLWCEGVVDHLGEDKYRLPELAVPVQLGIGDS